MILSAQRSDDLRPSGYLRNATSFKVASFCELSLLRSVVFRRGYRPSRRLAWSSLELWLPRRQTKYRLTPGRGLGGFTRVSATHQRSRSPARQPLRARDGLRRSPAAPGWVAPGTRMIGREDLALRPPGASPR